MLFEVALSAASVLNALNLKLVLAGSENLENLLDMVRLGTDDAEKLENDSDVYDLRFDLVTNSWVPVLLPAYVPA